jgi:3-hydroxyacyl-CoA dehydrogenase
MSVKRLVGSGIVESSARGGLTTVIRGVDAAAYEAARGRIEASLDRVRDKDRSPSLAGSDDD